MRAHGHFSLIVSAALFLSACCAYGLQWESTTKEAKLPALATHLDVEFAYKNASNREARILHVDTNCDCLSATPSAKVLEPGKSGTLTARFTVGERVGTYERVITVLTNESAAPTRLTVRIEVPELATLSPRNVEWALNSSATERALEVSIAQGLKIDIHEIGYSAGGFKARLETVEPGRKFRLWIKPESTNEAASVAVRLFGREISGRDVVLSAYASVR